MNGLRAYYAQCVNLKIYFMHICVGYEINAHAISLLFSATTRDDDLS